MTRKRGRPLNRGHGAVHFWVRVLYEQAIFQNRGRRRNPTMRANIRQWTAEGKDWDPKNVAIRQVQRELREKGIIFKQSYVRSLVSHPKRTN